MSADSDTTELCEDLTLPKKFVLISLNITGTPPTIIDIAALTLIWAIGHVLELFFSIKWDYYYPWASEGFT